MRGNFGSLVGIIDDVELLEGGHAAEVLLVRLGVKAHGELTDIVLVSCSSGGEYYHATDRYHVLVRAGVGL